VVSLSTLSSPEQQPPKKLTALHGLTGCHRPPRRKIWRKPCRMIEISRFWASTGKPSKLNKLHIRRCTLEPTGRSADSRSWK
jgi:hypothetical protein